MAQMLELERQFLFERGEPALRGEVLQGGGDETLRHLERGFDLDPGGRAGIEDRDGAGQQRGEKVDDPHRHEQLGADRPLVPKLLQHASIISTLGLACASTRRGKLWQVTLPTLQSMSDGRK